MPVFVFFELEAVNQYRIFIKAINNPINFLNQPVRLSYCVGGTNDSTHNNETLIPFESIQDAITQRSLKRVITALIGFLIFILWFLFGGWDAGNAPFKTYWHH